MHTLQIKKILSLTYKEMSTVPFQCLSLPSSGDPIHMEEHTFGTILSLLEKPEHVSLWNR